MQVFAKQLKGKNHLREHWKNIVCLGVFLWMGITASSQPFSLEIKGGQESRNFVEENNLERTYETRYLLENELQKKLEELWSAGFLEASFDSLTYIDSAGAEVKFNKGKQYHWAKLKKGNVDEKWLTKIGFRRQIYEGEAFKPAQMTALMEALLKYAEINGYPFAQVKLNDVTIRDQEIRGALHLEKGQQYRYGDLEILGDVEVSEKYLRNYLHLEEGGVYNEKNVKRIESQLDALTFAQSVESPEITFDKDGEVAIKLFLDSRNANHVDGILGLMPNSNDGKRFLVTGRLDLGLKNPFGKAMGFELYWEKNQPRTQELNLDFNYPFIFDFPIGADFNLELLKFDTLFLNINTEVGVRYLMKGANYLRIFYSNEQSNLIGGQASEASVANEDYHGYTANFYGLEVHLQELDYKLNPTKGYQVNVKGSVGSKSLDNPEEIGDNTNEAPAAQSLVYQAELEASYFIQLGNQSTFKLGAQGQHLEDDQIVFNQLFRFGGLGSIRGFDDKSLLASSYGIGTLEYRYLTGKDAFIKAFLDAAYYQRQTLEVDKEDTPYGFGLGYNFRTKAGIFSINYALGDRAGSPLNLRQGKIHFGITNLF